MFFAKLYFKIYVKNSLIIFSQDYSSYATGYADHSVAQYGGYYATPSYSPYVSSPSSSGSAGHTSYHLGGALSGKIKTPSTEIYQTETIVNNIL